MTPIDKHKLLIKSLLELEETSVLSLVQERLDAGDDPFEIIEDAQMAMQKVGERYETGNYYISSMMMAGEIFREAMEIIEPVLVQDKSMPILGHILLGTVMGDIHDIGKNIFSILLRSNGFEVTDLGVDVDPNEFIEEALRNPPDIVALSGLLTVSYDTMKEIIRGIKSGSGSHGGDISFIIGGGMINAMVCGFVGADYWATDAMMGVQLCKQIMEERQQD